MSDDCDSSIIYVSNLSGRVRLARSDPSGQTLCSHWPPCAWCDERARLPWEKSGLRITTLHIGRCAQVDVGTDLVRSV